MNIYCTYFYTYVISYRYKPSFDGNSINLGGDFLKAIFEGLTQEVNAMWEQATTYENVNYNNILSKI